MTMSNGRQPTNELYAHIRAISYEIHAELVNTWDKLSYYASVSPEVMSMFHKRSSDWRLYQKPV